MKEKNLLEKYPQPKIRRIVSEGLRTIEHRIIASRREKEFFDGDRNYGYGGFVYDGRWREIAKDIISDYGLTNKSNVLQINSEKGFLLHDIIHVNPAINVFGTETSGYAISQTIENVKDKIVTANPMELPFPDNHFDFVIGLGVVYTLTVVEAIKALKEITRVSKKNSFVTLASYTNQDDYFLFKHWTLLGSTILKKSEWIKILEYCNYKGDYSFTNSQALNLVRSSLIKKGKEV